MRGVVAALFAFAIFAGHDVVVKFLGGIYSPIQIIFFSVLFGFPTVIIALLQDQKDQNLRPRHPWWNLLRTGAIVITATCVFYAFGNLPLTQTYAILFATPLFITLLSVPILGEKVRMRRWMAVLVGLIGVLVALEPGETELELGHLAALTGAFGSAIAAIVVRKIGSEERSVVLMLYPMVANFLFMGIALPFVYVPMPIEHLGATALIAVIASAGTYLIIFAYRNTEAVLVAPTQYSQIIWATLFGFFLFGERPSINVAIGAAIIISSGIYVLFRESRSDTSPQRPVLKGFQLRHETGTSARTGLLIRMRKRLAESQVSPPP